MLRVVAKVKLKPGCKARFFAEAEELVQKSQTDEGCGFYGIWQLSSQEDTVAFLEEWRSQEELDQHMKTEHFTRICPVLEQFYDGPMLLDIFVQ